MSIIEDTPSNFYLSLYHGPQQVHPDLNFEVIASLFSICFVSILITIEFYIFVKESL